MTLMKHSLDNGDRFESISTPRNDFSKSHLDNAPTSPRRPPKTYFNSKCFEVMDPPTPLILELPDSPRLPRHFLLRPKRLTTQAAFETLHFHHLPQSPLDLPLSTSGEKFLFKSQNHKSISKSLVFGTLTSPRTLKRLCRTTPASVSRKIKNLLDVPINKCQRPKFQLKRRTGYDKPLCTSYFLFRSPLEQQAHVEATQRNTFIDSTLQHGFPVDKARNLERNAQDTRGTLSKEEPIVVPSELYFPDLE
jgi:hypothetical protein